MKRFNKSEIMKRAWQLKSLISYDTFSQALKHSWLVAKNEVIEAERQAEQEPIYAMRKAQYEAKIASQPVNNIVGQESYYQYSGQYSGD